MESNRALFKQDSYLQQIKDMEQNNSNNQLVQSDNYMQMMPIAQAQSWYNDFAAFTKSILKPELDYGRIPGTPKPTLYKAGAEKLRFVYGLGVEFEPIERTVDLKTPFIDYTYRCIIKSKQGQILSQCEGNCNSLETKFGYVWITMNDIPEGTDVSKLKSKTTGRKITEFEFAIEKAETSGPYGKPAEYWQKWKDAIEKETAKPIWKKSKAGKDLRAFELDETVTVYRMLNPDVVGLKNTIMKMAQKRAFVGAILIATGASEYFTQDIEDMEINGAIYSETHFEEAVVVEEKKEETADDSRKQKLTDKAFKDALKRIDAGEKELIGKLAGTFRLSSEQQTILEERIYLSAEPQTN